jgi:hypothetical protein
MTIHVPVSSLVGVLPRGVTRVTLCGGTKEAPGLAGSSAGLARLKSTDAAIKL